MIDPNLLKILSNAPKECIYCFHNYVQRKIQIYSTSNFVSHISRFVGELGSLNNQSIKEDLNNIKVEILETEFNNKHSRNLKYKQLIQRYKNNGYRFYNELSVVQYRLKESFQYKHSKPYYVVELVGAEGTKAVLIGVFSKWREARDFKNHHYKDGIITKVVIADNELTRTWYE